MKPVVDRLKQKYQGKIEFKLYDVDNDAEGSRLMQQFGAKYVPTFVLVNRDGTVSRLKVGEMPESELAAALDALK